MIAWQEWEKELLDREREWEKRGDTCWRFVPVESKPLKVDWWHVLTFALCLVSAACVVTAIWEVLIR